MADTGNSPGNWTKKETPLGSEIVFEPKKTSPTFLVPISASVGTALLSVYVICIFVYGWIRGEEILPGGVVVVCIMIGGMFLARFWYRHAFRVRRYVLGPSQLTVFPGASDRIPEKCVEKSRIIEILQLHTPPKEAGEAGYWSTCVVSKSSRGDKREEFFFEGDSEEVSNWLCAILTAWAGVPCRGENTSL